MQTFLMCVTTAIVMLFWGCFMNRVTAENKILPGWIIGLGGFVLLMVVMAQIWRWK